MTSALLLAACSKTGPAPSCEADALSTCLLPTLAEDWYIDQSLKYFDTLDSSADPDSEPHYADLAARWEWPPWLLLTGYGREQILEVDALVLVLIPGTTVPVRDCRAFDVQPFGRCRVSFDYTGKTCPIFEEFTFNDAGEVTFVEAWSDLPGLGPTDDVLDVWAEGPEVPRLSTRIPGLGGPEGRIDPLSKAMSDAAATDADVADFVARTQDFWGLWSEAYAAAGDDLFERGCGW